MVPTHRQAPAQKTYPTQPTKAAMFSYDAGSRIQGRPDRLGGPHHVPWQAAFEIRVSQAVPVCHCKLPAVTAPWPAVLQPPPSSTSCRRQMFTKPQLAANLGCHAAGCRLQRCSNRLRGQHCVPCRTAAGTTAGDGISLVANTLTVLAGTQALGCSGAGNSRDAHTQQPLGRAATDQPLEHQLLSRSVMSSCRPPAAAARSSAAWPSRWPSASCRRRRCRRYAPCAARWRGCSRPAAWRGERTLSPMWTAGAFGRTPQAASERCFTVWLALASVFPGNQQMFQLSHRPTHLTVVAASCAAQGVHPRPDMDGQCPRPDAASCIRGAFCGQHSRPQCQHPV